MSYHPDTSFVVTYFPPANSIPTVLPVTLNKTTKAILKEGRKDDDLPFFPRRIGCARRRSIIVKVISFYESRHVGSWFFSIFGWKTRPRGQMKELESLPQVGRTGEKTERSRRSSLSFFVAVCLCEQMDVLCCGSPPITTTDRNVTDQFCDSR